MTSDRSPSGSPLRPPSSLRRSPLCLCAFVPLCLLLPACQSAPTFTVTDVAMTAESDDAYVLTFTLEGRNPNTEPLPLREVSYALALDGRNVFRGRRSAQATLPARSTQTITLPVAIPLATDAEPPTADTPYRIAGTVEYLAPGSIAEILFDSRIRVPKASFAERGTFQFTD